MLQRNLVYTGVTRGKRLVVIVGQRKALAIAARVEPAKRLVAAGVACAEAGPFRGWSERELQPLLVIRLRRRKSAGQHAHPSGRSAS